MLPELSTKQDIRALVRERRQSLTEDQLLSWSKQIQTATLDLPEWKNAEVVCCYLSMPGEVVTSALLDQCWRSGKSVYVPARIENRYGIRRMLADDPIVYSSYHVPEPEAGEWGSVDDIDLMIVPGVAFDSVGGRIGHGAGHYDRLISGRSTESGHLVTAGLCFENQMFDSLPLSEHDEFIDVVITEKRVLRRNIKTN